MRRTLDLAAVRHAAPGSMAGQAAIPHAPHHFASNEGILASPSSVAVVIFGVQPEEPHSWMKWAAFAPQFQTMSHTLGDVRPRKRNMGSDQSMRHPVWNEFIPPGIASLERQTNSKHFEKDRSHSTAIRRHVDANLNSKKSHTRQGFQFH